MGERNSLDDAIRFWEFARIPYNLVLAAAVVIAGFIALGDGLVSYRDAVSFLPILIVLAVVANVVYCAAYPLDLIAQASPLRALWRAMRWPIWGAGTLLALMLAGALLFGVGAGWPD